MPAGRPTKYTDDLANEICDIIATTDRGLVSICKELNISPTAVYDWIDKHPEFANKYARARELQADFLADQIIEISDDTSNDSIYTDKGEIPNTEWISRSRLRVDARKWKASKLAPKKFGDKVDVTTGGDKITNTPPIIKVYNTGQGINDDLESED